MAGKLTALFLAVLIANPFCCCLADAAVAKPAADPHACCHSAPPESAPALPEDSGPCDCGDETREPGVLTGESKPAPPLLTLLTGFSREPLLPETRVLPAARTTGTVAFADAARPPGRAISQVHCRYLL